MQVNRRAYATQFYMYSFQLFPHLRNLYPHTGADVSMSLSTSDTSRCTLSLLLKFSPPWQWLQAVTL